MKNLKRRVYSIIATTLLCAITNVGHSQLQGIMLDEPLLIPPFKLTNEAGFELSQSTLEDQWSLIMFGFMSCPDVCPFTLKNLEAAYSETLLRVHPDRKPNVFFVSVDPARDESTVSDYASFFHPNFVGLTGSKNHIDTLIEATDSFYRFMPTDDSGYYEVQHSASVSIIDPKGRLVAKLQPPFDPGNTAEFIARLQIEFRRTLANQ